MTNLLENPREFLREQDIDYLLVNSTNEFLVEYTPISENSRYFLTGFSGSTGDALLSKDDLFLFVDGRYHIQADKEVDLDLVSVVKLQTGQIFLDELVNIILPNSTLGVFSKKNSQLRIESLNEKLKEKNVTIKLIDNDPIAESKTETCRLDIPAQQIDKSLTGFTPKEKIQIASKDLKENEAILITNLEEVSYLFNLRDFSTNYSCTIKAKSILVRDDASLFYENQMLEFEAAVKSFKGTIFVDKCSINGFDYKLAGSRAKELKESPIKLMKAVKTQAEIESYKDAFSKTDKTMFAIRDYIENNEGLSEFDVAQKLEEEFLKFGAKNLSFKPIVAKDKNSALAHYSKSSKDEIIKDGSLVLIDCGAYYKGGLATDITRVFIKGEANELQKQVYTTVLKAFLNCFNYKNAANGYDIDNQARDIFAQNVVEDFEFNHGLGHGIGINVHEYPPSLSKHELAKVEIKDNMCFTIEPGLYNEAHFGVRLENSCYMKDEKIISFTNMCYEKKLIDYDMLNEQEKEWLKNFEVK